MEQMVRNPPFGTALSLYDIRIIPIIITDISLASHTFERISPDPENVSLVPRPLPEQESGSDSLVPRPTQLA